MMVYGGCENAPTFSKAFLVIPLLCSCLLKAWHLSMLSSKTDFSTLYDNFS